MSECACDRCVKACHEYPGWFLPAEAERAAERIGIPFETFSKALILDHCSNQEVGDAPYVYSPRKIGVDRPDDRIRSPNAQMVKGKCVFLGDDNRCGIHEVKPFECREVFVCQRKLASRNDIEQKWIEAGAPLGMRPETFHD